MVKRNTTKGRTMIYKNNTQKCKDRATRTHLKLGVNSGAPHVTPVMLLRCSTCYTRRVTQVLHMLHLSCYSGAPHVTPVVVLLRCSTCYTRRVTQVLHMLHPSCYSGAPHVTPAVLLLL